MSVQNVTHNQIVIATNPLLVNRLVGHLGFKSIFRTTWLYRANKNWNLVDTSEKGKMLHFLNIKMWPWRVEQIILAVRQ